MDYGTLFEVVDESPEAKLTPHLVGPEHFEASRLGAFPLCVRFRFRWSEGAAYDLDAVQFVRAEDGPPLTATLIRSVPLAAMEADTLNSTLSTRATWQGTSWLDFSARVEAEATKSERLKPTDRVLELVAVTYEFCQVLRLNHVQTLQTLFGIPNRTASHWVRLARERGHLNA